MIIRILLKSITKTSFLVPYIDYVRNPTKKMELWAGYCSGDYKGLVIGEVDPIY